MVVLLVVLNTTELYLVVFPVIIIVNPPVFFYFQDVAQQFKPQIVIIRADMNDAHLFSGDAHHGVYLLKIVVSATPPVPIPLSLNGSR